MTTWSIIIELDTDEAHLDQARRAIANAVRFQTGHTPTTRTIRADALRAALGEPYLRPAAVTPPAPPG